MSTALDNVTSLPSETLALLISSMLHDIANLSTSRGTSTCFHSQELLPISVEDYMARVVKWLPASNDSLLLALVYLRRTAREADKPLPPRYPPSRHARPVLNHWTAHRLVLASVSLASKFISDYCFTQKRLAKVGGVSAKQSLTLEVELFIQLNFSLAFTLEECESAAQAIISKQKGTFNAAAFVSQSSATKSPAGGHAEDEAGSLCDLALKDLNLEPQLISPGWNNGLVRSPHPPLKGAHCAKPPSPSTESTASTETVTYPEHHHQQQQQQQQQQQESEAKQDQQPEDVVMH